MKEAYPNRVEGIEREPVAMPGVFGIKILETITKLIVITNIL